MSFIDQLQAVVSQVDGALACSIMGFDGIAVETHQVAHAGDLDLGTACVEFASILTQLKAAAEQLRAGTVSEVSINTDKVTAVMRPVSSEYFLVLALRPDGNFGKGRYALRIAAPKVRAEL
jgi:predicted regulator of Ras-like GTPase activity (Roadblock/LC7/MglB family)